MNKMVEKEILPMPLDPAPVVLEDPINVSDQPEVHTGLEPPQDAEPFTEPEEAPKNDEVVPVAMPGGNE